MARRGADVDARVVVVEPLLDDPVQVGRELVVLGHLPGQSQQPARDAVVVDARPQAVGTVGILDRLHVAGRRPVLVLVEAVGHRHVDAEPPAAAEEPQLVADDRPAVRDVQVVDVVARLDRRQVAILKPLREVVRLQRAVDVAEVVLPAVGVPALARDHADAHPAGLGLGRDAARLVDHLLRRELVVVVLHRAVAAGAHDELPVDGDRGLPVAHAVHRHVGLLRRGRQPHLRAIHLDARNQLRRRLQVAPGRDGVEHLAVEHLGLADRLHVDHRRLTGDGDRLFEGADRKHRVDDGREAGRQHLLLDQHGRESGQREGDVVGAGAQVDQQVAPRAVGESDPASLDQRRTRRLDGDAGQDAARVVGHHPGELAGGLRERQGRYEGHSGQRGDGR